ncbi:MAG: sulfotransferase [Sphingomicrobium sp.]
MRETQSAGRPSSPLPFREKIERPILIVSSPRSGSTLLFETLAQAPGLYSPGGESHGLIEGVPALSVPAHNFASNRLTADDAAAESAEQLARAFHQSLRDRDGMAARGKVRMLEKTPKNALRVPFFDRMWPDATFVFLYRDPRQTMASMTEAWVSGRFRTYPNLPGWNGYPWSLLLVPGWQELKGLPLQQIVARQWKITIETLIDDLSKIPRDRLRAVVYGDFLASPQPAIEALAASLDLKWDRQLGAQLPLSKTTLSRPAPDKWRAIEVVMEEIWPVVEQADARARAFVDSLKA